jgi:cell division protease FtsH
VAEELVFGAEYITTGAANDIEQATELARNMVARWGLSERLGPLAYVEEQETAYMGMGARPIISDETAHAIDDEVRSLVQRNYETARRILTEQIDKLHAMAKALIKYETIDRQQIAAIMEGREPQPPVGYRALSDDEVNLDKGPPSASRPGEGKHSDAGVSGAAS